jgi:vacuolar-type H+-ATPase subunit H
MAFAILIYKTHTKGKAMTKQDEISILKEAINKLGSDSYCGPWLQDVLEEVKRDMECDFLPAYTIADARKRNEDIIKDATDKAENIIAKAVNEANTIKGTARNYAESVRGRLITEMNKSIQVLNGF